MPTYETAPLRFKPHRLNGLSDHRVLTHYAIMPFAGGTAAWRDSCLPTKPAVSA